MENIVEKELDNGLFKRQRRKRMGIYLIALSLMFIPLIIILLIISTHSNVLVTTNIKNILIVFLSVSLVLFILGLSLYIMNFKVRNDKYVKNIFKYIYFSVVGIFIVFGAIFLTLFYGPSPEFKEWFITTLSSKDNTNYCRWFYSQNEIDEVLGVKEEESEEEPVEYANEYEKEILIRDEGNEDYKYIPVKVGDYDAHLVVIYDPSKVHLITSKAFNTGSGMESILDMCKRQNGKVCINGGRFLDTTGWGSDIPKGILIKDGKVIWSDNDGKAELVGFTNDNKLLLTKATAEEAIAKGMRDALEFGPFLMVDGEVTNFNPIVGGYERAARVAIAQRKDGIVMFLVTEGVHVSGPTLQEVIDLLSLYGAYNIANLDGGASAQLVIENKLINDPKNIYGETVVGGRKVVSGFGLIG